MDDEQIKRDIKEVIAQGDCRGKSYYLVASDVLAYLHRNGLLRDEQPQAGTPAPSEPESPADRPSEPRAAWLAGFRTHRDGDRRCPHGYGPGDHHWESGDCLADATYDAEETNG